MSSLKLHTTTWDDRLSRDVVGIYYIHQTSILCTCLKKKTGVDREIHSLKLLNCLRILEVLL